MKIGGADLATDLKRIEAVIEVAGKGGNVAVDANGRFDLETALAYGKAMQPYGLFWYEEPGDPLDFQLNAVLAERYPGALATGENLFSTIDGKQPAALRRAQVGPRLGAARSGAQLWSYRIPALHRQRRKPCGWPRRRLIPHGGHQLGLNMAAGLQLGGTESYPGVFQPYGGFADTIPVVDGYTRPHETPGIGMELRATMFADMRKRLGFE